MGAANASALLGVGLGSGALDQVRRIRAGTVPKGIIPQAHRIANKTGKPLGRVLRGLARRHVAGRAVKAAALGAGAIGASGGMLHFGGRASRGADEYRSMKRAENR